MGRTLIAAVSIAAFLSPLSAQEPKPVPKDSERFSISGCARGRLFIVGRDPNHETRGYELEEGMRLRLEGNKKVLNEIKAHEGSMVEITGLMKKSEVVQPGVGVAGGRIRIAPVMPSPNGSSPMNAGPPTPVLDVESYQLLNTACPKR